MNNYRELVVWQKSMLLVEEVYNVCTKLPSEEKYGLTSQIQRSAISIPSNIAEGAVRNSNKEFKHFLSIANGSCNELNTQLILINRIGYLQENELKHVFELLT
ncbi:four helix bundle protein [Psychroserpens sp. XS_ASV72]|uniref:four helix bundle protein n=1 Tax=Psychroserpens sp. XS_ASV72 TaxID=3241293 RepID=UPI003512E33C